MQNRSRRGVLANVRRERCNPQHGALQFISDQASERMSACYEQCHKPDGREEYERAPAGGLHGGRNGSERHTDSSVMRNEGGSGESGLGTAGQRGYV